MFDRVMRVLAGDPTQPMHPTTKNYVDTGGGVTDYGQNTSGTINPTLVPQQSYTMTMATTINPPPTSGIVNGQDILTMILGSGATYLLTIGGSPGINGGYPSSMQIPVGKIVSIAWQYRALGSRFTVLSFALEK